MSQHISALPDITNIISEIGCCEMGVCTGPTTFSPCRSGRSMRGSNGSGRDTSTARRHDRIRCLTINSTGFSPEKPSAVRPGGGTNVGAPERCRLLVKVARPSAIAGVLIAARGPDAKALSGLASSAAVTCSAHRCDVWRGAVRARRGRSRPRDRAIRSARGWRHAECCPTR